MSETSIKNIPTFRDMSVYEFQAPIRFRSPIRFEEVVCWFGAETKRRDLCVSRTQAHTRYFGCKQPL